MNPAMLIEVVAEECERFEGQVLELLRTNAAPPEALERIAALQYRISMLMEPLAAADAEVTDGGTGG